MAGTIELHVHCKGGVGCWLVLNHFAVTMLSLIPGNDWLFSCEEAILRNVREYRWFYSGSCFVSEIMIWPGVYFFHFGLYVCHIMFNQFWLLFLKFLWNHDSAVKRKATQTNALYIKFSQILKTCLANILFVVLC
jgi:nitrate reductase gamma subunit